MYVNYGNITLKFRIFMDVLVERFTQGSGFHVSSSKPRHDQDSLTSSSWVSLPPSRSRRSVSSDRCSIVATILATID